MPIVQIDHPWQGRVCFVRVVVGGGRDGVGQGKVEFSPMREKEAAYIKIGGRVFIIAAFSVERAHERKNKRKCLLAMQT